MQFVYSNVLFLMLLPAIILMYLIITKQSTLNKYFSDEIINKLSVSSQYFSNKARNITLFLALIFMIIALARPVTNEKNLESQEKLKAIVIALDISKSMKAIDIYPNRLEFAKRKLVEIIDYSKQNAIGIILFAKSSFILSPISQDYQSLKILVENLDTGMNFDNGTNIFSVLESSNKLFENYSNKNLIILTDGGDSENFSKELKFAKKNNINIYTIALATKNGAAIKLENNNYVTDTKGNIVNVKLNDKIKDLSLNSNGGYIDFTFDNSDIKQIIDDINSKSKNDIFDSKKHKIYTELFYYPLAIGIFLLLVAFSSIPKLKKSINSFIILFSLFSYEKVQASILDFQTIKEAKESYKNENYEEASKKFQSLKSGEQRDYDLANSYYKNKDYKKAIELYKNISTDNLDLNFQRLHNLANSYAMNNQYNEAINSYEEALKLKNDKQTKENLELIKKLENKNQNQENNQNNQDNQDNNEKDSQKSDNKEENKKESENQNKQKTNENENEKQKENRKDIDESQISNLEEEKWLKQLENQKTNSLLKKMESSKENSSTLNPW